MPILHHLRLFGDCYPGQDGVKVRISCNDVERCPGRDQVPKKYQCHVGAGKCDGENITNQGSLAMVGE